MKTQTSIATASCDVDKTPCAEKQGAHFFQNRACEYFPCHKGIEDEEFNCLFCYCPLYLLGRDCGGQFEYLANGVKSCANCSIPHRAGGYAHVMKKYKLIAERIRQMEDASL